MVLIQDRILKIDIYNFEMSYKTPEKSLKSNQIYSASAWAGHQMSRSMAVVCINTLITLTSVRCCDTCSRAAQTLLSTQLFMVQLLYTVERKAADIHGLTLRQPKIKSMSCGCCWAEEL